MATRNKNTKIETKRDKNQNLKAEISTPTTKLMFSGVIDKLKEMELPIETERSKCGRFVQFEGVGDPVPYWDDPRIH